MEDAISKSSHGSDATGMKKVLTAFDLTMLGIGGIIGAGVFVLTGVAAREQAGPAVMISYLIAGGASMLAGLCYTEFAVEIPVSGTAYNYVAITFGELSAFLIGCDLALEYTISAAAVARGWTSYASTLVGLDADSLRIPARPSRSQPEILEL